MMLNLASSELPSNQEDAIIGILLVYTCWAEWMDIPSKWVMHVVDHKEEGENSLSGPIPPTIGKLLWLTSLYLSQNQLSGPIPSELGNLNSLIELVLSENQLSGFIPSSFGNLTSLNLLYMYQNELSGPIPSELGNLKSPTQLVLSQNQLNGSIPPSFGNLTSLNFLYLDDNQLSGAIPSELGNLTYSFSQIQNITNSFKVILGQGGFGSVYKGSLTNGNLVAVKVLSESKGNGEDFINEVASVSRTSHVNIVNLVGFCLEGRGRALIYEFMPNGSLEKFIYGRGSSVISQLGWEKLQQIAIGIARGLEYLHTGCNTRILHFDIKPHNILLDQDFCPKISDFGLAKLFPEMRSVISMSHMRGTPGYIAPELYSRNFGPVSHKSDVYSYGMMILEMVGGRRIVEVEVDHTSEIYFPHWIYRKVEMEELGLNGILNDEENEMARKMIIVGLWCIQTNPLHRPAITKVLEMLEGNLDLLEIPPKPYMFSPPRLSDILATD
ncbi:PR5-like receptor kinase [Bidens hawaiensis]|uniref:PR5-like receptor kinase n=1 Tax=Bidens hawaiensis TaxID=980011 RepID=UPI004049BEDE